MEQNIATVSHILVEQRELAVEIKKKLEEGLDFGVLAQAHSTCPSKVRGVKKRSQLYRLHTMLKYGR